MKKNTVRRVFTLIAAITLALGLCTVCAAENGIAGDAKDGLESIVDGAGDIISDAASDVRDGVDSIRDGVDSARDDIDSESHTESIAQSEELGESMRGSNTVGIVIAVIVVAAIVILATVLMRRGR